MNLLEVTFIRRIFKNLHFCSNFFPLTSPFSLLLSHNQPPLIHSKSNLRTPPPLLPYQPLLQILRYPTDPPRNETWAEIPPITNNPTDRSRARVFTIQRSAVTWDATWLLYSIRVKRNVDGSRLGWDNKKWRSGRRTRHLIVRGTVVVVARTRSP